MSSEEHVALLETLAGQPDRRAQTPDAQTRAGRGCGPPRRGCRSGGQRHVAHPGDGRPEAGVGDRRPGDQAGTFAGPPSGLIGMIVSTTSIFGTPSNRKIEDVRPSTLVIFEVSKIHSLNHGRLADLITFPSI